MSPEPPPEPSQEPSQTHSSQATSAITFYTPKAPTYDYTWHRDFTTRFCTHISPHISPGAQILDLACGTGLLTFLLADLISPHGRVVGVDITPSMLAQARAKQTANPAKYGHIEFYTGDVLDLRSVEETVGSKGIWEGMFDIITVASSLVLFPDPVAAVQDWVKYLKPGGIIALDSTHPRNLVAGIVLERTARRLGLPNSYHREWSTSPHALREVLTTAGLEVESVVTVENQSGYGKRWFEEEDWDDHFVEKVIMGDREGVYRDHGVRRKAQAIFKEEWAKLAVNGRVEEIDSVFLGVGRKSSDPNSEMEKVVLSGGCRCGNVRYTSSAPGTDVTYCHCRACQQLSGSAYLPFLDIPTYALNYTSSSTLKTMKLSDAAERTFCTSCGSPISMVYSSEPDTTSLTMGSIDPKSFTGDWRAVVKKHIFLAEKAPWTTVPDDGTSRFDGFSDGTARPEAYSKPRQSEKRKFSPTESEVRDESVRSVPFRDGASQESSVE